jgi:large subunit ribosomal protein L9
MDIQVVLTENDPKLGKRGEVVKVSAGYAQNFLFRSGKAQPATPANLKAFEQEKAKNSKEEAERLAAMRALAEKLKAMSVEIKAEAGEGEKLFGAVTAQHIIDALSSRGIHIEKRALHLRDPIKTLGTHELEVKLHPEIMARLNLRIVKK